VGERVLIRFNDKWKAGKITTRLGALHYNVETDDGFQTKKHINQLNRTNIPQKRHVTFEAAQAPNLRRSTRIKNQPNRFSY